MVAYAPIYADHRALFRSNSGRETLTLRSSTVLGVRLHQLTGHDVTAVLRACIHSGQPHQLVTVNLDFLRIAHRDPEFSRVLNDADVAMADGMPVVWLSRLSKQPLPERIAGVDLVLAAADLAAQERYSLYLLGAGPGVAEEAARSLAARYPGLKIAGTYSPPVGAWTANEDERILDHIRATKPQFLFVALGAPRQDLWIHEHLEQLGVPICVGVGGTFDILAGRNKRAPVWMQRFGLEWAYRLRSEPRRLWRRYLLGDQPFLARTVAAQAWSIASLR